MLKITNYQSAHEFIKDSWELKRRKNPAFSLRAWAKQLGMGSHTPLALMINGKRSISKKHIPALIQSLNLSARDGLYLETLIEYNQSTTTHEKQMYYARLQELLPRESVQMFEMENFKFLGNPLHCAILELTFLKGFKSDSKWIQSRLFQKASVREIEDVIERLLSLGLLKRDPKGNLVKTHKVLSSKADVVDLGLQEYHKNVSLLASEMVSKQRVDLREYNGYAMTIKHSKLPRAKELMREFIKKFFQEVANQDAGGGEEAYQLNLQFFSLTQPQTHSIKGEKNEKE